MKQGWIQVESGGIQEELAPKTLAGMVYMDETQEKSVKDAIEYHAPIHLLVKFPAYGWTGEAAPYTQSVAAAELRAEDIPFGDVMLDDAENAAPQQMQLQAYGLVSRMDAENGQLTARCYGLKPETDFTVQLKVVR